VLAGFAKLAEDAQYELYYPELHERLFCVDAGPAMAADPWADEFGNRDESEEDDESDDENFDWNDLTEDAENERKKPWPHLFGHLCTSWDLPPDVHLLAPGAPTTADFAPPLPAQRTLLHLLQLLLI
jgi:hypothetical protein